jgi:hypothetical protein
MEGERKFLGFVSNRVFSMNIFGIPNSGMGEWDRLIIEGIVKLQPLPHL